MMPMLKKNQGSSSILVIVLLVVLLVFGLAVLTTALSNQRLADKKQAWLKDYYLLEGQVYQELSSYDHLLIESGLEAYDYIVEGDYLTDYPDLTFIDDNLLLKIYQRHYYDLVIEAIKGKIEDDPLASLYKTPLPMEMSSVEDFQLQTVGQLVFGIETDSEPIRSITYSVDLQIPTMADMDRQGVILQRYQVVSSIQAGEVPPLDQGIEFEDPFENPFE